MADTNGFITSAVNVIGGQGMATSIGIIAPALAVPDIIAPVVGNISPAAATNLRPGSVVSFDVTDESGLMAVIAVFAYFPASKAYDVVWDGSQFADAYAPPFSARTAITLGYRFAIARKGGWPEAPRIRILPVDMGGNIP